MQLEPFHSSKDEISQMASIRSAHDVAFVPCKGHLLQYQGEQHVSKTARVARMSATSSFPPRTPKRVSRAVVWFREGDLRLRDHPGFETACTYTSEAVAHLLVCTPATKPETLKAAHRLSKELNGIGSGLVLRYAEDEASDVIEFLTDFQAERVHVHMDVEHRTREVISKVEKLLGETASVQTWDANLREWDWESADVLSQIPVEYPHFLKWDVRAKASIQPSTTPVSNMTTLDTALRDEVFEIEEVFRELRSTSPQSEASREVHSRYAADLQYVRALEIDPGIEDFGEYALKEFLRRSDANERLDPARSLSEVFRQGGLSPRRAYEIICDHERRNGRFWRLSYRSGAKTVLNWLDAREFATLMARKDLLSGGCVDGEHEAKFWMWNGFLIRYIEEGKHVVGAHERPPLLLVHGFGASSQHYRRSLRVLKDRYHVFAVDLVGFGRSEKPPTQYTQTFWEKMLWDFVSEVIGRPVYVAGNSIGGYLACAFGSDAQSTLCCGVCLINSAGKLTDDTVPPSRSVDEKSGLMNNIVKKSRVARLLLGYTLLRSLRGRISKTLKLVYPTNPDAADEELATEIRRNSLDYGAVEVIASGLILPPPRSLTTLLQNYRGPLLVFQGELDPLNNAKERADTIERQYPSAEVVRVQAGHCPHEEESDRFVEAISSWMDSLAGVPVEPIESPKAEELVS